jgi:hypothetical protein
LHQVRGTCQCGGQIQRSLGGAVLLALGKLKTTNIPNETGTRCYQPE